MQSALSLHDLGPVDLTGVWNGFAHARYFSFSKAFTVPPSGPDPVFEARVGAGPWLPSSEMPDLGADFVAFRFGVPAVAVDSFRILAQPTVMSWFGSELTVPVSGVIPYP